MEKAAEHTRSRPVVRKGKIGLSVQTWTKIEHGVVPKTNRREHTLVDLSWALGWTDDSAQRILDGQEPIERTEEPHLGDDDDLTPKADRVMRALQELSQAVLELILERRR
ncbi:MAG TPA: hypothetical protein VD764_09005 [Nocardioides sp.]|nr:hypothetical protein [Nocardioides sp.]